MLLMTMGNIMDISLLALIASLSLLLQSSFAAADSNTSLCYKKDGSIQQEQDKKWRPCDPTANISNCCSENDWCMSNGLCLNGISNQYFSEQGCSSSNWESPCRDICSKSTVRGKRTKRGESEAVRVLTRIIHEWKRPLRLRVGMVLHGHPARGHVGVLLRRLYMLWQQHK